jgi:Protein of unknown function (DUF433)
VFRSLWFQTTQALRLNRNISVQRQMPADELGYRVSMILELLAGNMTSEEILADYPDLERKRVSPGN